MIRRLGRPSRLVLCNADTGIRNHYKVDQLTESIIEYIQRVYTEVYDLPHIAKSVIARRALVGLAEALPDLFNDGLREKEKQSLYASAENRISPFGLEGLPKKLTDKNGKLKSFKRLGREASTARIALLDELSGKPLKD